MIKFVNFIYKAVLQKRDVTVQVSPVLIQ